LLKNKINRQNHQTNQQGNRKKYRQYNDECNGSKTGKRRRLNEDMSLA